MRELFLRYFLPGLVFQSLIISGGYSTGRELIEFFMQTGPLRGLCGMLLVTLIFAVVLALTFEFARIHNAHDYRTFFRKLLGRGWVLFDLSFIAIAVLVLAVVGAASGILFAQMTGSPRYVGTFIMMIVTGILAFHGSTLIEKALSAWSFVLYSAYIALFIIAIKMTGSEIQQTITDHAPAFPDWRLSIEYSGINLAAAPAVLFAVRHIRLRREAVIAGFLAGPLAMMPGIFFYIILLGQYPSVIDQEVPLFSVLQALQVPGFALLFSIVIFGTYMESGIAMVHAVNERIASLRRERGRRLTQIQRVLIAVVLLVVSIYLASSIGLIDLIKNGYGTLTYLMLAVYVLPLLVIGLGQILWNRTT